MDDLSLSGPDQNTGVSKQKRVNRGYALREDLIKELKLIAVREDRNLYQVMEEAIEQYLARRAAGVRQSANMPTDRNEQ